MKTVDEGNLPRQMAGSISVDNLTSGSHLHSPAADDIEELVNQCISEFYEPPIDSSVPVPSVPQVSSL